jgi:hypothetical protein
MCTQCKHEGKTQPVDSDEAGQAVEAPQRPHRKNNDTSTSSGEQRRQPDTTHSLNLGLLLLITQNLTVHLLPLLPQVLNACARRIELR